MINFFNRMDLLGNYTLLFIVKFDNPNPNNASENEQAFDLFRAGLPEPVAHDVQHCHNLRNISVIFGRHQNGSAITIVPYPPPGAVEMPSDPLPAAPSPLAIPILQPLRRNINHVIIAPID